MDSSESEPSESSNEIAFSPAFQSDFKFLGRDWLFSRLSKHINGFTSRKNVILLLGGIGSGKTCLLRQLAQTGEFKSQTLAYYECDESSDDCSFVLQLVRQLKKRIPYLKVPSYLQLEKDKQNTKGEYSSNESLFNVVVDQEDDRFFRQRKAKTQSDIFWNHFLFPLIEHGLNRWEEDRYLVLIDSVDLKTEIFELIVKHLHLIPKYLFLVLSARPNRQADLFKKFVDSRKFQIDDMRKQYILADLKAYVQHQLERLKHRKQLKEYTAKVMINQLSIKSNGCYYFVRLFIDYVEKEIFNPDVDLNLGCTIHGLFLQAFAKLFVDKDRKVQYYKSILSLVLASQANQLNKSLLTALFINPTHIDNCLRELEHFQLIYLTYNEDGDTLINLTNYPLQDWLNDIKLASRRYFCNANFGHLLLINITPNIAVEQYCYQIDQSDFPVFDLEHKLIWLLLEIDHQQLNLLDGQSSEVARELSAHRSRLHKNHRTFGEIYRHLFTTNLLYDEFAPKYATESPAKERSCSLINLQTKQPRQLTVGISAIEQRVLSTFSKLTLKSIEPEERDEKKINFDYDVFSLLKAAENLDLQQVRCILNGNPDLVNKYVDDDPLLFHAIRTESKQLIELLVEFNVDVNQTSEYDKQTALMLATQLNLIEIALILLECDADLDAVNKFGQSAIVYAILYKSKPRLSELLLLWGSSLDYLDHDGKTLLLMSCVNSDSDLETVRLLISCDQNLYHQDQFGKSCLHLAAVHGNYELIEYLVEIGGEELVCLKDNEGKMPIHFAVIYGANQVLPLLACERSINSISLDGCSPLRTAAFEFQYDCLHTLIDCCGADVNSVDNNGRSVLYSLALKSNDNPDILEMMKELIKLHANLELCASENKTTVLHIACFMSFEQTVSLLLSAGAEVNAVDIEQRTALHLVCASTGNTNIMRKLIEHGIEIDARTVHGATSLMFAAQQGQYDACKLLLEFGANVWLRDEYGSSVRDILISCNYGPKMRKLFEKYFGIIGSDYDVSVTAPDPAKNPPIYSEACSPISNNNPNLSSANDLAFNLSIDKEDGATCNSMQGEGRSWIADSVDNLASYAGSGQNLSNCSPMQSAYNINYFNSANNLKTNNLVIGGSHNHLVAANPKLLSPNFRAESFDQVTKKDKRANKISSMGNKLSRFLH